jgi:hypothetical protein
VTLEADLAKIRETANRIGVAGRALLSAHDFPTYFEVVQLGYGA